MKAIVFVDVQKDFIDGALRNEKAIEVTPKIVEWAKELVVSNPEYKFYATRDTHNKTIYANIHHLDRTLEKDVPWQGYLATLEGKKLPVEHCIEMTEGWMIDDRLMSVLDGGVTIVNKPTFGSFDLAEILAEDEIRENCKFDEIIICGFVSSICVASNAIILRAKFPNTKITVMKDLCAGITEEDHNAAMKVLEMQQIDVK